MGGKFNWAGSDSTRARMSGSGLSGEQGSLFIELLLALCFSLVILGILQQLTSLVYTDHNNNANQAELQYSARMALDCIQRDIRCARDFEVSADGSKLIITDAGGKIICIYVQNGNLYRQYVSNIPVAENLTAVHFDKSDATLQGKLKLKNNTSNYDLDFFCFSRTLQAQDEGME